MNRAVFLDRDGVINRLLSEKGPRETPTTPAEFELLPDVPEALARLKRAGFLLLIVTNQPNVAKGKSTPTNQALIEAKCRELTGAGTIDQIYTCLHHPDATQVAVPELLAACDCRKPKPGLILIAQQEFDLDLSQSWLVGDDETDIAAGLAAGLNALQLIKIGTSSTLTEVVASSLFAAAHYIIRRSHGPQEPYR